jgi:hypothetical protein
MRASSFGISIVTLVVPGALCAQVLAGVVREDSTGRPMGGVEVTLEGKSNRAQTDSAGRYAFGAPGGVQIVIFRAPGYRPVRMRVSMKSDTVQADASLVRASQATHLDPVHVNAPGRVATAGRDGFEERRAQGFGKFIDSVAMRARESRRLSDVLRELSGVKLIEYREPPSPAISIRAVSPTSPMPQSYDIERPVVGVIHVPGSPPCFVSVFFNGTTIYRSERRTAIGQPPDFSRDFSVSSLESVEYYRSASPVPPQFGGSNADCGALVLWSRR